MSMMPNPPHPRQPPEATGPAVKGGAPDLYCLGCDYPLAGLPDHTCPECGRRFDPRYPGTFAWYPRPRPSSLLLANTVLVLIGCLVLIMGTAWAMLYPTNGWNLIGGPCILVFLLLFALYQYRAVFGRSTSAAHNTTILYFVVAAFAAFGLVANLGEAFVSAKRPISPALIASFLAIGGAIVAYTTACGFLNRRWARQLERYESLERPAPPMQKQ